MYATSTAIAQVLSTAADTGLVLGVGIGILMGCFASLLGLGFFKRKVTRYITGTDFMTQTKENYEDGSYKRWRDSQGY